LLFIKIALYCFQQLKKVKGSVTVAISQMGCGEVKLVERQSLDTQHFPCTLSIAVVSISKQE